MFDFIQYLRYVVLHYKMSGNDIKNEFTNNL